MSAYVVDNSTIHKIVAYLRRFPDKMPGGQHIQAKEDRYQCGPREVGKPRRDAWAEFGTELRLLNVAAVEDRYPDHDELPGVIGENEYTHKDVMIPSDIVAHKALGCFLYQCAEGNVPETELYQVMETTYNGIAYHIISELPAWQAASWG